MAAKKKVTKPKKIPKDYEYDNCRTFGHTMKPYDTQKKASWGFVMSMKCQECGMERIDTIDRLGQVSTRRYIQPSGYGFSERHGRREFRLRLAKRLASGGS